MGDGERGKNEWNRKWVSEAFWGGLEVDVENSINVLKVIYEEKWKILIEITQLWLTQPLLRCVFRGIWVYAGAAARKRCQKNARREWKTSSRNRKLSTRIIYGRVECTGGRMGVWGRGRKRETKIKKNLKPAKCEKWIINSNNISSRVCIVQCEHDVDGYGRFQQCNAVDFCRLSVPSLI